MLRAVPASVDSSNQPLIEKIKEAFGKEGELASAEELKISIESLAFISRSIG